MTATRKNAAIAHPVAISPAWSFVFIAVDLLLLAPNSVVINGGRGATTCPLLRLNHKPIPQIGESTPMRDLCLLRGISLMWLISEVKWLTPFIYL